MVKAELIEDIKRTCPAFNEKSIVVVQEADSNDVTWYMASIFETGYSEENKKPTAYRRNIHFYVYKEGLAEEEAYYDRDELKNDVNRDFSGSSSLSNIYKIYNSSYLKSRIQAAIIQASFDIINEAKEITIHDKRIMWAGKALSTPSIYTDIMTAFVALNATVQAAGGLATDNDLKYIVYSNIDNAINILGI
jgi:hypothetical protein